MFQSVIDYTKELESTAIATEDFIKKLKNGRNRIIKNIAKANAEVSVVKDPDRYVKSLLPAIQKDVLNTAKDIVQGQILVAIRENYEFDWPLYRRGLFLAAANKDAYKVYSFGGAGWSTRLIFTVNFDSVAGRLEDWSRGVKLTRKALEVKVPRRGGGEKQQKKRELSALQASRAWAGIFGNRSSGKTDTFSKTIKSRLQYSGRIAPFWQLLDKGIIPMPSDRGGYATPKGKPTKFIQNSQEIMESYTKNLLKGYKDNYNNLLSQYSTALEEMKSALTRLNNLVDKLELDRKIIQRVEQEYGFEREYIDGTKLAKVVQLVLGGTLTTGRVEITSRGSRKRIRPSIRKITRIAGVLY